MIYNKTIVLNFKRYFIIHCPLKIKKFSGFEVTAQVDECRFPVLKGQSGARQDVLLLVPVFIILPRRIRGPVDGLSTYPHGSSISTFGLFLGEAIAKCYDSGNFLKS